MSEKPADEMSGYDDLIYQPKTSMQKIISWVMSMIFFAVAIFTIFTLLGALQQITRKDLQLSEDVPNDRCIPFFDTVKSFVASKRNTRALYDFRTGEAIVRVCSNETSAVVNDALGVSTSYDPWKQETNCDVLNNMEHRALFEQNCEFGEGFAKPFPPCGAVLTISPMPLGFHWNGWAVLLPEGSNKTTANGTIVKRGKCAIELNRNLDIAPCTVNFVGAFHTIDTNVAVFMYLAVAVPFFVMLLQFCAVWRYSQSGWTSDDGYLLAFANRGPSGALYALYWWCKEGEDTDKGKRGELPDVYLTFSVWLICAAQDATEGLAAPIVAVLGCSVQRFPVPLALIVVKGLKFIYDFISFLRKRNLASEPGSEEGQHKFAKKELEEFYKSKGKRMPHNAHLANKAGTMSDGLDKKPSASPVARVYSAPPGAGYQQTGAFGPTRGAGNYV